jgi:hypothetical protein
MELEHKSPIVYSPRPYVPTTMTPSRAF